MDTDDSNAGEGEGEDVASKILSIVGRAVLPAKQTKCKAVSPSKSDKMKRLEEQQGKFEALFNEELGNGSIDTETMKKIQERRAHLQALFARLLLSL